jgi:hypothetical protein
MTAVSIETIQPDPAVIFDDATAALDEDFDDDADFTGDDDDIDDVPAQRGRSREPSYIDLRDAAVLRMAPDLPADQAGLDTVAREAFEAFHAAVVIGDEAAMMAASIRYDAVVWKLNGGAFFACEAGNEAVSPRLRARLAAAPGAVPLWGQSGEFLVDHAGIRAIVIARGGPSSLQVEFRAVSATGPFISNTGYRSLCGCRPIYETTMDEAAKIWISQILTEKKGREFIGPQYRDRDFLAAFPWAEAGEAASPAQYQEPTGQFAWGATRFVVPLSSCSPVAI